MQLKGSVAVLGCVDVANTLAFYQQALQFIILRKRSGPAGIEWVYLQSGDTTLMLEKSDPCAQDVSNQCNSRIYFFTDDVYAMHHLLKAKGYSVSDIKVTTYMKEFDMLDPDGQRLSIGQPVAAKTGNQD